MVPSGSRRRSQAPGAAGLRAVEARRVPPISLARSAAVGVVALAAYLFLAPAAPGDKDSGEFTLVLALDGVAHPTGYPLYTLFGHGFVTLLHALGATMPYATNAWSSLGAALAVAFLHALAARLASSASRSGALALLPVGLFALNPVWTVEATVAEVYSWHLAWVLGATLYYTTLVTSVDASPRWPRGRLLRHALGWGSLCGVGGAHHVSAIYVAAPLSLLLAYRLIRLHRLALPLVLTVLVSAALPLSSYASLLPKAAHPGPATWGNLAPGWNGLVAHVTGQQYQFLLGRFDPSPIQRGLLAAYVYPFLALGLVALALAAWLARAEPDRWMTRSIAVAALVQTLAVFGYGASDPTSYFLAPLALGLCAVVPAARALGLARRPAPARALVAAGTVAVLLLWVPWVRTGVSRRNGYERFEDILHSMWQSIPFERGFVLWGDDMFARLRAYQLLDGEKRDLEVLNPWWLFFPPSRARFAARHGYDPVEGVSVPAEWMRDPPPGLPPLERILDDVAHRINDRTELPVVVFDGEKRSVRLLTKSGKIPTAGDGESSGTVPPRGE